MPEVTIQVGDAITPGGHRDGDIVDAANDAQLLWMHTQRICDHRKIGGGFFKTADSLAFYQRYAFKEFMFERVSMDEVRRTRIGDGTSEILSGTSDEYIHVDSYIRRRVKSGKLAMFGNEATAVWFGGRDRQNTRSRLGTLWTNYITPLTGLFASNHMQRDYPVWFEKAYLRIVTNDFSDSRREAMLERGLTSRRKRHIDWRALPDLTGTDIDRITDRSQRYQIRRDRIRTEGEVVRVRA